MFKGAPFGLKTLTSIFQRVTSRLFRDCPFVAVFVDDILVFSSEPEAHIGHVSEVIKRLTSVQLTLNIAKCKFAFQELRVLGHFVSKRGIMPDNTKLSNVLAWPTPKTGRDIQSFLGLLNYFRDSIPLFAATC